MFGDFRRAARRAAPRHADRADGGGVLAPQRAREPLVARGENAGGARFAAGAPPVGHVQQPGKPLAVAPRARSLCAPIAVRSVSGKAPGVVVGRALSTMSMGVQLRELEDKVRELENANAVLRESWDEAQKHSLEKVQLVRSGAELRQKLLDTERALDTSHREKLALTANFDRARAARSRAEAKLKASKDVLTTGPGSDLEVLRRKVKRLETENASLKIRVVELERAPEHEGRNLRVSDLDHDLIAALRSEVEQEQCESDAYGAALMEQLASGRAGDDRHDDDDYEPRDPRDAEISVLEQFLSEEHRLRICREQRIAQLMKMLDNRLALEERRIAAEVAKRAVVEARLESVTSALEAERAGRVASEVETAGVLRRTAARAKSCRLSTTDSQMFASPCVDKSNPTRLFMWAGRDQAEDDEHCDAP